MKNFFGIYFFLAALLLSACTNGTGDNVEVSGAGELVTEETTTKTFREISTAPYNATPSTQPTLINPPTATPTLEPKPTETVTVTPTATPVRLLLAEPVIESQFDLQAMQAPFVIPGQIENETWLRMSTGTFKTPNFLFGYEFDGPVDELPVDRIVVYDMSGNQIRSYDHSEFDKKESNRVAIIDYFRIEGVGGESLERIIQYELLDEKGNIFQVAGPNGAAIDLERVTLLLTRNEYDDSDRYLPETVNIDQHNSLFPKFVFRGDEEVYKVSEGTMSYTFAGTIMEFLSFRPDLQKQYEVRDTRDNLLFTMEDMFANPDRSIPEEYVEFLRENPFKIQRILSGGEIEEILFFEIGLVYDIGALANGYFPFVGYSGLVSEQKLANVAEKFGRSMQDDAIKNVFDKTHQYYGGSSFGILTPQNTFMRVPPFNRLEHRIYGLGRTETGSKWEYAIDDLPIEPHRKVFYHPGVFIVESNLSVSSVLTISIHEFGHVVEKTILSERQRNRMIRDFHETVDKSSWFDPYVQNNPYEFWAELVAAWSRSGEIPDLFVNGSLEFTEDEYLEKINPQNTRFTFAHDTFQLHEFYNWFYEYFGPPGMGADF